MLRPIRLIIPALLTLGAANSAVAQPAPLSPRNANYTLRATLTPATRTLEGRGRLTWRNTAAVPATELRFHLYWNAWRDAHSTWFKEQRLGSHQRFSERPADDAGWMDMTALTLVDGEARHSLLSRAHYVAPDDGNERDRTVLAVPLDAAVPPGDTIELDLSWTARVPRTVARTGVLGRYYFIAQWFPKIGVFEDTGWNCHQFHMTTEFFADFGVYDVSLTVPTGWVVGATGVERGRQTGPDGTTTHRYVQADVHDFAWTTSPDFLEVTRRVADAGARPVDVRLLLQPAHAGQIDRHVSAIRATLASYAPS
jgi:hypothetical protein